MTFNRTSKKDTKALLSEVCTKPKNYQTGLFEGHALDTIAAFEPISIEGLAHQLNLNIRHVREILSALEVAGKVYSENRLWYTAEEGENDANA